MRSLRTLTLVAVSVVATCVASCATCRPREQPCPRMPVFDREAERVAVLAAVLEALYVEKGTKQLVVDPTLALDDNTAFTRREDFFSGSARMLTVADGRHVRAPAVEGLEESTVADWVGHTKPSPAPEALCARLPVAWFAQDDWDRLPGDFAQWRAFHERFGRHSAWIHLTDVGFSAAGGQALVHVAAWRGFLAGHGAWVLLTREGAGWRVVRREVDWIS